MMDSKENTISDVTVKDILYKILDSKRIVGFFVVLFLVLGIVIALLTPKEYTSSTTILPQLGSTGGIGKKFGGIAKLVGVKLGEDDANVIIPTLYPIIVKSTPYQNALLETRLKINDVDSLIPLSYYLSEIYDKGFISRIKSKISGSNSNKGDDSDRDDINKNRYAIQDSTIYFLTDEQIEHKRFLESHLDIEFNDVDGYLVIRVTMPEPIAAAQLAKKAQELLQKFLIDYNIQKSKDELEYIEERFNEAENEYKEKRAALGSFRDRNKNIIGSYTFNREEQLKSEYDLAYAMYSQLATQMESSRLQVSKDTPIFTVLRPVTIPKEPSAPNKLLIVFVTVVCGILLSFIVILYKAFFPVLKRSLKREHEY